MPTPVPQPPPPTHSNPGPGGPPMSQGGPPPHMQGQGPPHGGQQPPPPYSGGGHPPPHMMQPQHGMPPGMMDPREHGIPGPPPGMMSHGHPGPPMPHPHMHPHMHPQRVPPYMAQPDYRIFEMNKRLQQRTDECDNLWWDSFANEFFEDDATLTLSFMMDDGPKRYTIGRTLIPRYFRSIFESGCSEVYYSLRRTRESFHTTTLTLDAEQAVMVMTLVRPLPSTVHVEGRLALEFTLDDLMRIRAWNFQIRTHREMVLRAAINMQEPSLLDQLSKNFTRNGVTNNTLNFFRLCLILEPMQELMSRQKAYSLSPRDCLKTTLFQKWQRMVAPTGQPQKTESSRPASKRRKRKASNANSDGNSTKSTNKRTNKASAAALATPPATNGNMAQPGDVMVVGEPTLMGGEFGDEDERLITRLENSQFDANANNTSILPPPLPPSSEPPHMTSSSAGGRSRATTPVTTQANGGKASRPRSNGTAPSPQNGKAIKEAKGRTTPQTAPVQQNQSDSCYHPGSAPPSVCGPGSAAGTPVPPPVTGPSSNGPPSMSMMMPTMTPMMHPNHNPDAPYL